MTLKIKTNNITDEFKALKNLTIITSITPLQFSIIFTINLLEPLLTNHSKS